MGRGWKNFEVLHRKNLCLEEIIGRNIAVKRNSVEGSEREKRYRESVYCLREDIFHREQNVARNMNGKCAFGDVLDGKEKHVIGHWRKDGFVLKWQRTWLNYILLLEGEQNLNALNLVWRQFAWSIPSSVEGAAWLLLATYNKM